MSRSSFRQVSFQFYHDLLVPYVVALLETSVSGKGALSNGKSTRTEAVRSLLHRHASYIKERAKIEERGIRKDAP